MTIRTCATHLIEILTWSNVLYLRMMTGPCMTHCHHRSRCNYFVWQSIDWQFFFNCRLKSCELFFIVDNRSFQLELTLSFTSFFVLMGFWLFAFLFAISARFFLDENQDEMKAHRSNLVFSTVQQQFKPKVANLMIVIAVKSYLP